MAHAGHYHYDHLAEDSPITPRPPVSPLLQSQHLPLLQTTGRDGHELNSNDLVSPLIMSPSPSIASDSRTSALSGGTATLTAYPANVQPPAAYVAPFGAAQVVSDHQSALASEDGHEGDLRPSKDDVSFSPSSLALINAFLDQLLFSFLSTAKSTTLSALRNAVTEILRHKLARDAIASANEELADLLAGGDEEDEQEVASPEPKLDVDLVWRRTRLRVMVYMRLGEMEDDDEERYVKEQDTNGERGRFSSSAGLVSWSAAIFLTSVLEHVAEQTLQAAGTAAFGRVRQQEASTVLVDDQDAERIALNPALGRLWRSWRKAMRTTVRPTTPVKAEDEVAPVSPSPAKSVSTFRDSFGTAPESARGDDLDDEDDEERVVERPENDVPEPQYPEYVLASNIHLPMGDPLRDVDEIEVPGLARDPSEIGSDGTRTPTAARPERRRSFSNFQSRQAEDKTLSDAEMEDEEERERPVLKKRRSTSVPAPMRNLLAVLIGKDEPEAKDETTETAEATPTEPKQKTIGDLLLDEAPDAPRSKAAQEDYDLTIEELDKRKSLIDIKTLLAAINGGHAAFKAEDRPSTKGSDESYSLGNKENGVPQQPVAEPQHMDEDNNIGVATTSDRAIVPERSPSAAGTKSPSPPIASNLSRTSSTGQPKPSPEAEEAFDDAPEEPPARDRPIEPNAQTLAMLRDSVNRASSPQTTQQVSETTQQNRKSIVSQYASPVSAFNSQAQQQVEPPAMQRSMTPKEDGVSASIRGPQDFDQFGQSDEAVKYNSTPEPVRDAPVCIVAEEVDVTDHLQTANADSLAQLTGQVPEVVQSTANDNRSGRSQNGKVVTSATAGTMTEAEKKRHRFSVTKPPSRNSSVLRRSGMMAREARVITESTRDFADFIRSTKPDKEPAVQPLMSQSSAQAYRNSTNYSLPRSQSLTGERTKSMTSSDIAKGFAPPVPILPSTKPKASMQPRTANGVSEESGELIAFIRDGPRVEGQPRISRQVAPFRNTMDSDQFDALKATAKTPTNRNSMYRPPNGSSNSGSIAHPAYSGAPQTFNPLRSNPADVDVTRKRYRNKDPYAIDLDDEEDISALPRGRQSEVPTDGDKPIASAASLAQARELMERARAKGSRPNSVYTTGDTKNDEMTALPTSKAADRLGYGERSNTNDLAQFLRESEPPSAPAPSVGRAPEKVAPLPKEKKKRGFSFFFRRSSTKGARHADMP